MTYPFVYTKFIVFVPVRVSEFVPFHKFAELGFVTESLLYIESIFKNDSVMLSGLVLCVNYRCFSSLFFLKVSKILLLIGQGELSDEAQHWYAPNFDQISPFNSDHEDFFIVFRQEHLVTHRFLLLDELLHTLVHVT